MGNCSPAKDSTNSPADLTSLPTHYFEQDAAPCVKIEVPKGHKASLALQFGSCDGDNQCKLGLHLCKGHSSPDHTVALNLMAAPLGR